VKGGGGERKEKQGGEEFKSAGLGFRHGYLHGEESST
jgi:hypothetical protein